MDMPDRFNQATAELKAIMVGGPRNGRVIVTDETVNTVSVAMYVDRCVHNDFNPAVHAISYHRTDEVRGDSVVFKPDTEYDEVRYVCAQCVGESQARKLHQLTWQYRIEAWWKSFAVQKYFRNRLRHLKHVFVRDSYEFYK